MALSLERAGLVWGKVAQATANANPVVRAAFRALKVYLTEQKGNPTLQFIPFNEALIVASTGYSPIGGVTSTLYGVYFIKNGTSGSGTATDSWLTIANDTSNVTDATKFVALMTSVAGQQAFAVYPHGLIFGTDLTISGETSAQDGTESTANDSGNGFVIVGA